MLVGEFYLLQLSEISTGVLGGFGAVTTVDVKESNAFLDKVLDLRPGLRLQRVAGAQAASLCCDGAQWVGTYGGNWNMSHFHVD